MIRIVLAIVILLASIISVAYGAHPSAGIIGCVIAMTLLAWYCVSKYEDNQFVSLKG